MYSYVDTSLASDGSAAASFQQFFSKLFGKKGKPFGNPALFFYLSGFFTVVIIMLCIIQAWCIVKIIRRRKMKKNREIVNQMV